MMPAITIAPCIVGDHRLSGYAQLNTIELVTNSPLVPPGDHVGTRAGPIRRMLGWSAKHHVIGRSPRYYRPYTDGFRAHQQVGGCDLHAAQHRAEQPGAPSSSSMATWTSPNTVSAHEQVDGRDVVTKDSGWAAAGKAHRMLRTAPRDPLWTRMSGRWVRRPPPAGDRQAVTHRGECLGASCPAQIPSPSWPRTSSRAEQEYHPSLASRFALDPETSRKCGHDGRRMDISAPCQFAAPQTTFTARLCRSAFNTKTRRRSRWVKSTSHQSDENVIQAA